MSRRKIKCKSRFVFEEEITDKKRQAIADRLGKKKQRIKRRIAEIEIWSKNEIKNLQVELERLER
jgi:hypothetical protein